MSEQIERTHPLRRTVTLALAAVVLAGCAESTRRYPFADFGGRDIPSVSMYAALDDEPFPVPAVNTARIDPRYLRQIVDYPTAERPGTIIVDTARRFLYLVREDGTAVRYGIGVGRDGFSWSGRARVGAKQPWPTWTPPREMIAREPELEKYRDGMPPGLDNPLGARALYIHQGGRDTLYRLHGTFETWSIGKAMSSGCIRLLNQDIIDLYSRVPLGAPIVVLPDSQPRLLSLLGGRG